MVSTDSVSRYSNSLISNLTCTHILDQSSVNRTILLLTGLVGVLAAVLVGTGEYLMHFDARGRFGGDHGGYDFMKGIASERSSLGHFFAVLGAPLYLIGYWHLMKMLEPANKVVARFGFFLMSYGIMIGAVWIGSRTSISSLINVEQAGDIAGLIKQYEFRYENLLTVTRISVLGFSVIFMWLCLTGRSHYPRWMAMFNPILLLLSCFLIWMVSPGIGIYIMPIALNVSFGIVFMVSIYFSLKINNQLNQ